MVGNVTLESRRKRLQKALSELPYKPHVVDFTKEQKLVLEIVERLRSAETEEKFASTVSNTPPKEKPVKLTKLTDILDQYRTPKASEEEMTAEMFAEKTMQSIEQAERDANYWVNPEIKIHGFRNKLDILASVASQICVARRRMQAEFSHGEEKRQAKLDEREREKLMTMQLDNMLQAQLNLAQLWEAKKREALRLLTVEIDKLQILEDELLEAEINDNIDEIFDEFRDSPDLLLNTSTPKSSGLEEEESSSESNESEISTKNRKKTYHLKTVPSSKYVRIDSPEKPLPSGDGFKVDEDGDSEMITIGPNGTQIKRTDYNKLNWSQRAPAITRKVLCSVFDRKTLIFNTLTGKPSPAFVHCDKPTKGQLDPLKVADIVHLVMSKVETTQREVRTAITTKCADENKMYRRSNQKSPKTI